MAVVAAHRGKGIGEQLLRRLHEEARGRGTRALSLSVERANPAIGLYERLGYSPVDDATDDGDAATMALVLD